MNTSVHQSITATVPDFIRPDSAYDRMVSGYPRLGPFWFAGDRWETIRMGSDSKMFPDPMSPDLEHVVRGGTLADLFAPTAPPSLPDRLTPKVLREAIAGVLARVSANELAEECVRFGLPPEEAGEDGPWRGKYRYVERRIRHWMLPELLALGRHVAAVYDDDRVLNHLLGLDGPGGVRGEMKNLIFAADGPKPRIVLRDAINNDLEIVENGQHCLIYDRPLPDTGLTWRQLTTWWARNDSLDGEEERSGRARTLRPAAEVHGPQRRRALRLRAVLRPLPHPRLRRPRAHPAGLPAL